MKYYLTLGLMIILFVLGIYFGYLIFQPKIVKEQVNSQVILETLKNEGFLATQTYIFNQSVTIDKNTGIMWKDFFWGQEINASAVVEVNSGVDLTKLTADDIKLTANQINLTLPQIEVQSVELLGDIELRNSQGILKKIFDDDDGYNLALSKIKSEAQKAASDPKLVTQALTNTQKEITRLLHLAAPNLQVTIDFK